MGMNRSVVGRVYENPDPFEVTSDGAQAYAAATNASLAAYEGGAAVAPPMYGSALSFAGLAAPLFDPQLELDMMRLVHGEQEMVFLKPVHPGDSIKTVSRVLDIVEKPSGEVITIGTAATNQHGEAVLEATSALFVRAPRKRETVGAERSEVAAEEEAWCAAPVAWSATERVAPDQSVRYAEASGDHNPIHLEDDVARMAGLPGTILHGLCTMAFVHNACVRSLDGDPMRLRRLAVRFHRPVLMGDVLTIEARGPRHGPWQLRVTNQAGVLVLGNGVAEVT